MLKNQTLIASIVLTPEQLAQLSTPSYKFKKEKRDKSDTPPSKNSASMSSTKVTLSPTLVDPAQVSVIRTMDGQDTGLSALPAEKKKKKVEKKSVKSKSSASTSRPAAVSTNQRFEELDQKWSDRFNQLCYWQRLLNQPQQELTFGMVKVVPAHSPPDSIIRSEPFIRPTDQPVT